MKACAKCKVEKSFSEFNRKGDKHQPYCRECQKATYKSYYDEGNEKERLRVSNERRRQDIRTLIRMTKDVPCADCGQRYPHYVMDFDHQYDKKFNIGPGAYASSRENLLAEIAKCEVVCANCHRERTFG